MATWWCRYRCRGVGPRWSRVPCRCRVRHRGGGVGEAEEPAGADEVGVVEHVPVRLHRAGVALVQLGVAGRVAEVAAGECAQGVAGTHLDPVRPRFWVVGQGEGPADVQDGVVAQAAAVGLGVPAVEVEDLPPAQWVAQLGRGDVPQRVAGGDDVHAAVPGGSPGGRDGSEARGRSSLATAVVAGAVAAAGDVANAVTIQPTSSAATARVGHRTNGVGWWARPPRAGPVDDLADDRGREGGPDAPAGDDQQADQQGAVVGADQHRRDVVEGRYAGGQERAPDRPQRRRGPGQQRGQDGERDQAAGQAHQFHPSPPGSVATSWACAVPVVVTVSTPTRPSSTVGAVRVTSTRIWSAATVTVPVVMVVVPVVWAASR